jgi:uncharacterized SAM-binding protein YcdF (DUF218 family)
MTAKTLIARTALGLLIAVVGVWAGCLLSVLLAANRDETARLRVPAVAIIVLGAAQYDGRPSPVLRARLDHAVTLWRQGLARRLIVTGGRAEGDRTTEAAVGRRYAVEHGVPDSAILLESEGRTTDQSLRAAAALLREIVRQDSSRVQSRSPGDADQRRTAILVSDPFHMLRLGVVARRYGIVAYTSPTRTSPISGNSRLSWRYMFGESLKVPFIVLMERSAAD